MFFKSIKTCIIIAVMSYAGFASAASFSLNKNSNIQPEKAFQGVPKTKDIVVTGYGLNEEEALKNAFRSAIEQYVGVVIDSATVVKNSAVIDESLLTASNGFIQTYKKLSTSEKNGLVTVKILATVQSQKLLQEIHSLHIATVSISGTKEVSARIETKQIAKKDAVKMLSKAWREAWSNEAILDLLSVNIDDVKPLEDQVNVRNQVPLRVTYSISVNRDKYKAKIHKLETLFKQLGAKHHTRFDLPDVTSDGSIGMVNKNNFSSLSTASVLLMKHYGKGLVVDMWEFPDDWTLNFSGEKYLSSIFHLVLEIKDQQGEVLYPKMFKVSDKKISLFKGNASEAGYSEYDRNVSITVPFLPEHSYRILNSTEKLSYSINIPVDLEDLKKIGNISLELEKI